MRKRTLVSETAGEPVSQGFLDRTPLKTGIMLAFWGGVILLCWINRDSITVENIVNYVPENTAAAICIMLVLFALKGITVIVYGSILYAASGVLFSLPVAICVNLAGTVLMTSIPFFIGKRAGTNLLDQLVRKNKRLELLRDVPKENEFFFSFAVRMIGLLPGDLVGMYAGACGLTYSHYICGTVMGLFPSILTFSVMGMSAHDISSPAFLISAGSTILLMALSLGAFLLWRKKKHKENKASCPP